MAEGRFQSSIPRTSSFTEVAFRTAVKGPGPLILLALGASLIRRMDENGWGSLLWLATCTTVKFIRMPFEKASKDDTFSKHHRQVTDSTVLCLFLLGGALIPMVHLTTGLLGFANYSLPFWVPAISLLVLAPGVALFRASHVDLGRNWSAATELRDGHTLVTTGVYTHVRHPMYTALWMIFSMFPLLIQNWIAGWSSVAAFALLYFVRVPYEEGMMQERFGEAYVQYMKRSGRLWPRFGTKVAHQQ